MTTSDDRQVAVSLTVEEWAGVCAALIEAHDPDAVRVMQTIWREVTA